MEQFMKQRFLAMTAFLFAASALAAQQAELRVDFKPNKAYILVDGKAYDFRPRKPAADQHEVGFTSQAEKGSSKEDDNAELENAFAPAGNPLPGRWGSFKLLAVRNLDPAFLNCRTLEFAGPLNERIGVHYTDAAKHARTALAVLPIPKLKLEASVPQVDRAIYTGLRSRAKARLILVTCYPFYFIGAAPKGYLVQTSLTQQTGTLPVGHP